MVADKPILRYLGTDDIRSYEHILEHLPVLPALWLITGITQVNQLAGMLILHGGVHNRNTVSHHGW